MIKTYCFAGETFTAGTAGVIQLAARMRKNNRWGNLTESRSPKNRNPPAPRPPQRSEDIVGRLTYAALTSFAQYDRRTIRAMVRHWLTATEHTKPAKELPETNVAFDARGKRISLKVGRWLSRHINPTLATKLTDKQIATIAARFPMSRQFSCPVEIIAGQDCVDCYSRAPAGGGNFNKDGIGSCMTGGSDDPSHEAVFLGNEDRLKMVIGDRGAAFRAKIWRHDITGLWNLDRVYTHADKTGFDERTESALIEDALRRWLAYHDHPTTDDDYCTTLKHDAGNPLPYHDRVWKFSRLSDTRIKFHPAGRHDGQKTDGTDESCPCCVCCCCDDRMDEDDSQNHAGDTYCEDCYSERFTYCDETDSDEPCDDVTYDEVNERSILDRNSVRLMDGRTTHEDDATELDRDIYGRGEYALTDETCETDNCETILAEDAVYLDDGDRCFHCSTTIVQTEDAGQQPEDDCTEDDDGLYWLDIANRPDIAEDSEDRSPLPGQLELPLTEEPFGE